MRRLLVSLASCGAAAASLLPTLETRGATFKTLRDIDVYRPSGERLTLGDLLGLLIELAPQRVLTRLRIAEMSRELLHERVLVRL